MARTRFSRRGSLSVGRLLDRRPHTTTANTANTPPTAGAPASRPTGTWTTVTSAPIHRSNTTADDTDGWQSIWTGFTAATTSEHRPDDLRARQEHDRRYRRLSGSLTATRGRRYRSDFTASNTTTDATDGWRTSLHVAVPRGRRRREHLQHRGNNTSPADRRVADTSTSDTAVVDDRWRWPSTTLSNHGRRRNGRLADPTLRGRVGSRPPRRCTPPTPCLTAQTAGGTTTRPASLVDVTRAVRREQHDGRRHRRMAGTEGYALPYDRSRPNVTTPITNYTTVGNLVVNNTSGPPEATTATRRMQRRANELDGTGTTRTPRPPTCSCCRTTPSSATRCRRSPSGSAAAQ